MINDCQLKEYIKLSVSKSDSQTVKAPSFHEAYKPPQFGISLQRVEKGIKIDLNLICSICNLLLNNPVLCKVCENHFCLKCIEHYRYYNNDQCADELKKKYKQRPPQKLMTCLLSKLNIYCVNKSLGCDMLLKYDGLDQHEHLCDYNIILCKNAGCNESVLKKNYQTHLNECEFEQSSCSHCNQMFTKLEMSKHLINCDYLLKTCPGCQESMSNNRFKEHINACQSLKLKCKNCETILSRELIKSHDEIECISFKKEKLRLLNLMIDKKLDKMKRFTKGFVQCNSCIRIMCESCGYKCNGEFCQKINFSSKINPKKEEKSNPKKIYCQKCFKKFFFECGGCLLKLCKKCILLHQCPKIDYECIEIEKTSPSLQKRIKFLQKN